MMQIKINFNNLIR